MLACADCGLAGGDVRVLPVGSGCEPWLRESVFVAGLAPVAGEVGEFIEDVAVGAGGDDAGEAEHVCPLVHPEIFDADRFLIVDGDGVSAEDAGDVEAGGEIVDVGGVDE